MEALRPVQVRLEALFADVQDGKGAKHLVMHTPATVSHLCQSHLMSYTGALKLTILFIFYIILFFLLTYTIFLSWELGLSQRIAISKGILKLII